MTVRIGLHAPTAVNRNASVNVIRVVEKAERTDSNSLYLPHYRELPARRMRTMNFALIRVQFFIARADRHDVRDHTFIIHDKQNLALQIHFDVRIISVFR